MKKLKITVEVPKHKTRAHLVLFCEGTPFKQKVVENKKAFKRNKKHRSKEY